MAWCPNCKTEYREGITTCADCGVDLVDTVEEGATYRVAIISEEEQAQRFVDFLSFSELPVVEKSYNEEEQGYEIFVSDTESEEAKKLFQAFAKAEETIPVSNDLCEEDTVDKEDDTPSPSLSRRSLTYVKKEDRYKDLQSTAYIFTVFGFLGLVFVALNVLQIITLLTTWVQFIALGGVCIAFIIIGIRSYLQSKETFQEIDQENVLTTNITAWLQEHMTKEALSSF